MGSFETESLGEFALKGLQQKMPVHSVLGTGSARVNTDTLQAATN
jgi:hypothetical protein